MPSRTAWAISGRSRHIVKRVAAWSSDGVRGTTSRHWERWFSRAMAPGAEAAKRKATIAGKVSDTMSPLFRSAGEQVHDASRARELAEGSLQPMIVAFSGEPTGFGSSNVNDL